METEKPSVTRRKKREVAVAPRSGAKGYRLAAWLLMAVSLGLIALTHFKVALYPGDKLFPQLCRTLLLLVPPLGVIAGVVGCMLSRSPGGRTISLMPLLLMVPMWFWLLGER